MKTGWLALAAIGLATSASANTSDNPLVQETAILSLEGLDLSTVDGQQRLAVRMDQAARAVCGEGLARVHLELEARSQDCRAAVVADVRNQIETRMAKAGSVPVQLASAR